ncbi:MAG: hypothetical protein JO147_08870, partial [Actinobacteria bacterium]|nr:hypothetical protein [Actinomycetota bacterium]
MTTVLRDEPSVDEAEFGQEPNPDRPRKIVQNPPLADRIFTHGSRLIGFSVVAITGSIGVFLAI